MSIELRAYQAGDLAELLQVWENSSRYAHPFLSEAVFTKVKADIPALYLPNADTWVVTENNKVVGFIALLAHVVGALFVDPSCHSKGYGKLLMDKASSLHAMLELDVFKENPIGRGFYRHYGFIEQNEFFDPDSNQQVIKLSYSQTLPLERR